jgi:hypothetical protein
MHEYMGITKYTLTTMSYTIIELFSTKDFKLSKENLYCVICLQKVKPSSCIVVLQEVLKTNDKNIQKPFYICSEVCLNVFILKKEEFFDS